MRSQSSGGVWATKTFYYYYYYYYYKKVKIEINSKDF